MTILNWKVEFPDQVQDSAGQQTRICRLACNNSLSEIMVAGYLNQLIAPSNGQSGSIGQGYVPYPQDMWNIYYSGGAGIFSVSIASNIVSLIPASLLPSSLSGQIVSVANASATPGTIRSLTGKISSTVTNQTSGNLVGLRGEVDVVGTSGSAYIYGIQGKIIATGTLAAGQFEAGVFGQLDISAATINGGQLAPIWGDYGTSSGTLSDQSGLYGIAMTNTTHAVPHGQLYLYGGATNFLLLNDNNGLVGATYFVAAGTSGGSAGDAAHCAASKVLKCSINGVDYWIPLFASNS